MKTLPIEPDVPLPAKSYTGPRSVNGRTAAAMNVRDSVFCEKQSDMHGIRDALRGAGKGVAVRKVEGGWRVWRMK